MSSIIQFKNKESMIKILLNTIIFLYNIKLTLFSECDFAHPFKKKNGGCVEKGCSASDILSGNCIIENDIVKAQWLNNIINFSGNSVNYSTISTTPNGNLICSSSSNKANETLKYYLGIKNNGRPFF